MPFQPGKATAFSPASIPVHDYGNVGGDIEAVRILLATNNKRARGFIGNGCFGQFCYYTSITSASLA